MFEQSDIYSVDSAEVGNKEINSSPILKSSHTSSSAFQVAILGIDSMSDVMSFFKGFFS